MPTCELSVLHRQLRLQLARLLLVIIGSVSTATPAPAQLPVLQLTALSQSGGKIGETLEVRPVAGGRLDEIEELHFSHPGIQARLLDEAPRPFSDVPQPRYGHFQVSIADDVPAGLYEARARGRHGISNPRAFWVDQLDHTLLAAASHAASAPTALPHATWLHGRATAAEIDYYVLHAEAGQRLRIDLLSQQVDSRMIGMLVLMDVEGRRLQSARGTERFDPHLVLEAEKPGDFVLAVHDFLYRGGEEYFYQVAVRPVATENEFEMAEPAAAVAAGGRIPRWSAPQALPVVACQDLATWIAHHSNPPAEKPHAEDELQPPCRLRGRLDPADERAQFEFAAMEGTPLCIELISERVGEPTDLRLTIERSESQPSGEPLWRSLVTEDDGQQIGDAAVSLRTTDPIVQTLAPATADYRILVQDLDSGQALDRQQVYWLDIRTPAPDYALLCYRPSPVPDAAKSQPQGSNLMRGGAEAVRVLALRRDGWSGPIRVSVEGLPPGVRCAPVTIAPNQQETQLSLVAAEDASAWVGSVRVVGRATVEGEERMRDAVPATIVWGAGGNRDLVVSRLSTELTLSVSQHDTIPLSIEFETAAEEPLIVKKGGALSVPIRLVRRGGGKANCVLRPRDLPAGVTAAEVTIAGDATAGTLELKIAADAAAGEYSLWLQTETQITMPTNPQALARAEQERARLTALREDTQREAEREQIDAAIAAADAQIEAARAAAQPTQVNVFLPSPSLTLQIVDES